MATATQLYDSNKGAIYPTTLDQFVTTSIGGKSNIKALLESIVDNLGKLSGADKESVELKISYALSDINKVDTIISNAANSSTDLTWGNYVEPTASKPYLWMRIQLLIGGIVNDKNTKYAIVATYQKEYQQTWYVQLSESQTPVLDKPKKYEGSTEVDNEEEYQKDDFNPSTVNGNSAWTKNFQGISNANPKLYQATRYRNAAGEWGDFFIGMLGRWTPERFETLYYAKTPLTNAPTYYRNKRELPDNYSTLGNMYTNYAGDVSDTPISNTRYQVYAVKGFLVNGAPEIDKDGYYWSEPIHIGTVFTT